jgi:K+-transporting ATPase KdpF subunit
VINRARGGDRNIAEHIPKEETEMAIYVLLMMVAALVIYLFYAVIHPEHF